MSRLGPLFDQLRAENRRAVIPYLVAGDPDEALTVPLMHSLVEAGADIIEVGVPFSDPMSEGPTIQKGHERALEGGTSLLSTLSLVKQFREKNAYTPLVLMGYANPLERKGYAAVADACAEAGIDGLITVDLPPEEVTAMNAELRRQKIDNIFLISPTTSDARITTITAQASGFIYYVALKGVTGAGHLDTDAVEAHLETIRQHTSLPVAVGFGIKDADTAATLARCADAVVVGSALVELVANDLGTDGSYDSAISGGAFTDLKHPQRRKFGNFQLKLSTTYTAHRDVQGAKMSWIDKIIPAGVRKTDGDKKANIPEGLWRKCVKCDAVLYRPDLERNAEVCPKCDHHMRITARRRLDLFLDDTGRTELFADLETIDRLKFKDKKRYRDRLSTAQKSTGEKDAIIAFRGTLHGLDVVAIAFEFNFHGGSMGYAVGEKFTRAAGVALENGIPLICFAASGGARMQEALISLMQMAKTSAVIERMKAAGVPYVSVMTDPIYGGVSASLALLGDINVAEPDARAGFAGPNIIEQTIRQKLPRGFQRSEFLLEHGAIDMIIPRFEMRDTLGRVLAKFTNAQLAS